MKVVWVSYYAPNAIGDGGYHRAYQVVHDLEAAVGPAQVIHAHVPPPWDTWTPWPQPIQQPRPTGLVQRARARWQRGAARVRRAAGQVARNPYRLLAPTTYRATGYLNASYLAYYEEVIATEKPALCVLENTRFGEVVAINQRHRLPTVGCPQNLEAFDTAGEAAKGWGRYSQAADFATELSLLAACRALLFISRVETGLVGGLGLDAHYYPYLPVGEVYARQVALRRRRAAQPQEPGLFLMMGSAGHGSTRAAMQWFCRHAQAQGLPSGVRVVVAGNHTQELLPPGVSVAGLELRGWMPQPELDDLLGRAWAVLVPQRSGFGALTRLPEYACAGVPAIVSHHPLYALDPPPGLLPVADEWPAWTAAMQSVVSAPPASTEEAYTAWQARQPRPLERLLAEWPQ
jgi:hypothetical protein